MNFTMPPKSAVSSSESASNSGSPELLLSRRESIGTDILEVDAAAGQPLRSTVQVYSVRFDDGSGSETEEEKVADRMTLDAKKTKPLGLIVSSDSESENSVESSVGEDAGARVKEHNRADSPDLGFDGEVTVYYDTVTMNPEWENLDEIEDENAAKPATTDTLSSDSLSNSPANLTQPSVLIDHTQATLSDTSAALLSDADSLSTSSPFTMSNTEHPVAPAHDDPVAEEYGDVTTHFPGSPVDYDADTSSWFPAHEARDNSDTESDDDNDSSEDERSFAIGEPTIANDISHEAHFYAGGMEQNPEAAASPAPMDGDVDGGATPPSELSETPVVDAAAQLLGDNSNAETFVSTLQQDSATAPVPVPATRETTPPYTDEALEALVADSAESVSLSTTEDITVEVDDTALSRSEESDEPFLGLSRAISIHSGAIANVMDSVAIDTVTLVDAPTDTSGEIVVADHEVITDAVTNSGADASAVSNLAVESNSLEANASNALKVEPIASSETVVEAVEPMSLAGILGMWVRSVLYLKLVSFFLRTVYRTIEYIESIVPAGLFSVIFIVMVFIGLIMVFVPFMGFTGVVSIVGILLGYFHVSTTNEDNRLEGSTCPMNHGILAGTSEKVDGIAG